MNVIPTPGTHQHPCLLQFINGCSLIVHDCAFGANLANTNKPALQGK